MNKIDLKAIIEKCKKSDAKIEVAQVVDIMTNSISLLYNRGTILKRVEKKIGQEDWNILITSVLGTYLSSLYATVELKGDAKKAAEFGKDIGASEMALIKEKDSNNEKHN